MVQLKSSYPLFSLAGSEDVLSQAVEAAVLSGLEREPRCSHMICEYVRTYQEERRRLSAEADIKRVRLE